VNKTDKGNYGIPTDNPYIDNKEGFREEIFAYGLRNPWRFSFDAKTGQLWAGDVGQNEFEEIDIITKGGNYGWRLKEGERCYNPRKDCENGKFDSTYPPISPK
jgi:glucose/arabinose dehydrogenase